MYSSCLYCNAALDANPLIEALPVGRRMAFDSKRGRLWVICVSCVKWNLVPFDSRLEAIDECERIFRGTTTRYSTDNIGLARHAAGVDLIRIGAALRPEFAAWRYGDRLARRRRVSRRAADAMGALIWLLTVPLESVPVLEATRGTMRALYGSRVLRDPWTDQLIEVPYAALVRATLVASDGGAWRLEVPYRTGVERRLWVDGTVMSSIRDVPSLGLFGGDRLLPALARVLPAVDDGVPTPGRVAEAVRLVESSSGVDRLYEYVVGRPLRMATERQFPLTGIAADIRLALEMVAHEDTEARAMEGELKLLERQWRDAEEVAAIADRLALEHRPA